MADIRVELLVGGGGLAGRTRARAAAGAGIETALVDREPSERRVAEPFDGRTTALAWASRQVYAALGVWPDLAPDAEPIREIRVADGASSLFPHYAHALIGDHPLGFIVENRVLRRVLLARLARLPLHHLAPAEVSGVEYGERAVATLADGRRIRAELVAA